LKYHFFSFLNSTENRIRSSSTTPFIDSIKVVYINLNSRKDRRLHIENELNRIGFLNSFRFAAIENKLGILGCTLSHQKIIEQAIQAKEKFILIVEDDAQFTCTKNMLEKTIKSFLEDVQAEVLCLGNNVQDKPSTYSKNLLRTKNTQTTSCYLIKSSLFGDYQKTLQAGIDLMEMGLVSEGAIDIIWKKLQQTHLFLIPKRKLVYQIASHSDISNEVARYLA